VQHDRPALARWRLISPRLLWLASRHLAQALDRDRDDPEKGKDDEQAGAMPTVVIARSMPGNRWVRIASDHR